MKKKNVMKLLCAGVVLAVALTACGVEQTEISDNLLEQDSVAETATDEAEAAEDATNDDVSGEDGIAEENSNEVQAEGDGSSQVADASDMSEVIEVVEEGMVPITGSQIKDGTYDISVNSSSAMFKIESCELVVENGEMMATMTMGGTGYLYLYMGTGEEAVNADESEYIPFVENDAEQHTFTVPVEALDAGIACSAFSKRKEMWYDRTLCFRADSLPLVAISDGMITSVEDLGLVDGFYNIGVTLEGGSGRTTVDSPAPVVIENGDIFAYVTFSSPNYDYMLVDGEKYLPVNEEGNSCFYIPVAGLDWKLGVIADTTAMSQPYEIEYTLYFDSTTVEKVDALN